MIDPRQLVAYVIEPTLEALGMSNVAAVELVLGTAIQESNLRYLRQLHDGPALGLWQMEPDTHDDIWNHWLAFRPSIKVKVREMMIDRDGATPQEMIGNLYYACAMCRLHYRRVSEPLPTAGDREGQAKYWKDHYNTHLGKGTPDEYVSNWQRIMGRG